MYHIDKEVLGKNKLFNPLKKTCRNNQISTFTEGKLQYLTKFQNQYLTYTLKCKFKHVHPSYRNC